MAPSDRLEVVNKCIIDGSASKRPDNGDGLRARLLRNDQSEPRGDLSDQPHQHWAAFLNDSPLSDKACSFGDGLCEDPTYDEIVAFRCIVILGPTAEAKRAVPAMTTFLSVSVLETVADVIELDALSEDLDAAMVVALGARVSTIDAANYGCAYRKVDRRKDRVRQIYLVKHLGQSLDRLANRRFAGTALVLMRKPAQIAGFGDLHAFLERGYAAVHTMGSIEEFLTLVVTRERRILKAVFAGDDSLLSEGSAPRADSQARG